MIATSHYRHVADDRKKIIPSPPIRQTRLARVRRGSMYSTDVIVANMRHVRVRAQRVKKKKNKRHNALWRKTKKRK